MPCILFRTPLIGKEGDKEILFVEFLQKIACIIAHEAGAVLILTNRAAIRVSE